jgi:hypothetical protein
MEHVLGDRDALRRRLDAVGAEELGGVVGHGD